MCAPSCTPRHSLIGERRGTWESILFTLLLLSIKDGVSSYCRPHLHCFKHSNSSIVTAQQLTLTSCASCGTGGDAEWEADWEECESTASCKSKLLPFIIYTMLFTILSPVWCFYHCCVHMCCRHSIAVKSVFLKIVYFIFGSLIIHQWAIRQFS